MADNFFLDLTGAYSARAPLAVPGIALRSRQVTLLNGETYTPDLREAAEHNILINGAAVTIGNPVLGGQNIAGFAPILLTHVRNISGGVITITWGSAYKQAAFTDPTDGNGVITMWHFDRDTGLWYSSGRNTVPNA